MTYQNALNFFREEKMDLLDLLETEERTDPPDPRVQLDLQDHRVHAVRLVNKVRNHYAVSGRNNQGETEIHRLSKAIP